MSSLRRLSVSQQIAAHLREELGRGRWSGPMPGVVPLARELGVSRNSMEAAFRQLETEGLITSTGAGRRRLVVEPDAGVATRPLRVAILLNEREVDLQTEYIVELQHALVEEGHSVVIPVKSLSEIGFRKASLTRLVNQTAADAWVICAGSREVLEWFSERSVPAFALFGRRRGLPIAGAGPDKPPAIAEATRRLIDLGHSRISLLCRRLRRLPEPGHSERNFLDELSAHGISVGNFNLPDWEETGEGFRRLLDSLFQVTPPTALITDEAGLYVAALHYFSARGIRVPEDVSLICTDWDASFHWCNPTVAHIRWDARPVVRRIIRWAADVSQGRAGTKQTMVAAEFVEGGSIGPAPE